jgi:hypothetical protein
MEKELMMVKVDYTIDWMYGVDIKQVKKDLDAIEELGANYIDVVTHGYPNESCDVDFIPMIKRMETDDEFKKRCDELEIRKDNERLMELIMLEHLKNKYEK